jgi:hypothetical protein
MIVAGMRSAEKCYRNVRRYSAGVTPVARRNARVKLDYAWAAGPESFPRGRFPFLATRGYSGGDVAWRPRPHFSSNAKIRRWQPKGQ